MATMSISEHAARDRSHFNAIAVSYCVKDLSPSSRSARRQRLQQTLRCVNLSHDITMLEVGCGSGFSAPYLAGMYQRFVGIDYSEELIAYAQAHNVLPGVSFDVADINDFHGEPQFDVALMIGVLHHLDDLALALRVIAERLKPGGWIVANEPQPANPFIRLARKIRKKVDRTYSSDQVELTSAQLTQALIDAGFESVRTTPQGIFSTPFAEVPLKPSFLWRPVASAACLADRALERTLRPLLHSISWNLIASGRKPLARSR